MHPELEKLIELAVVDGKLTDKEKEILQRKARELNVDLDELDMVLEAKLFIQNKDSEIAQPSPTITATEAKNSLKQENIKVTKFFNEDYKEYLKKIICKEKILFDYASIFIPDWRIIEGIDPIDYLNKNVTVNTYLKNGELLLRPSIEELLVNKLFDDIIYIFNKSTEKEFEKTDESFIVKLYLDGEKEKSRYELEKLITIYPKYENYLIYAAYCFSLLFNDSSKAKELLEKAKNSKYYKRSVAEAWKLLFNDNNRARSIIVELQNSNDKDDCISSRFVECAFMWKELLGDDREAKRCLISAEKMVDVDDISWDKCAEAWKQLYNDDNEAKRCIKEIEKEAIAKNSVYFCVRWWIKSSECWKKILNNDNEAKRCLKTAEDISYKKDKSELESVAKLWKELFNDSESAMRCMQKYESNEKASKSWWKL